MDRNEALRLDRQLCFPLYAASRKVIGQYKPFLDEIGLTYTQYIAMMVLWEEGSTTVKALGSRLYLDSGTLTPLLKKMEVQGLVDRARDPQDERSVIITLTEQGRALQDAAAQVPLQLAKCMPLEADEAMTLYNLLYKLLAIDCP